MRERRTEAGMPESEGGGESCIKYPATLGGDKSACMHEYLCLKGKKISYIVQSLMIIIIIVAILYDNGEK